MAKLTLGDLDKIKDRMKQATELRVGGEKRARVVVHMGTCGIASGAREIMAELMKIVEEKNLHDVVLTSSGCAGLCSEEPMITVELPAEPAVKYLKLTREKIREIFEEHVMNGHIVEKYALAMGPEKTY
jgi:NADP-reducing hydrogenase subunit HndB